MLTIPRKVPKKILKIMLETNDCKKWVIAMETGHGGYDHYQVRLQTSNDGFFEWTKNYIPTAHVEKAQDAWEYERKEGHYWTSWDTNEIRSCRFGCLTKAQRGIMRALREQNDRQIDVLVDKRGNWGKSWLARHLYETGEAFLVPPTVKDVQGIVQWIASGYNNESIVIIDIPRSWKWSEQLYTAIETIKDGMVYDTRYHAQMRDIWGVKVLVFTNEMPKVSALSADRWRIKETAPFS